eukprot:5316618-Pyramimonas_sp.AAC.1
MRRVRAGTHGSVFWARQSPLRASGHARGRFRGAPECAECERARTKRYFLISSEPIPRVSTMKPYFGHQRSPQHTPQTLIRSVNPKP